MQQNRQANELSAGKSISVPNQHEDEEEPPILLPNGESVNHAPSEIYHLILCGFLLLLLSLMQFQSFSRVQFIEVFYSNLNATNESPFLQPNMGGGGEFHG